ncbi:unnamed protein product [Arabis nemorensis]|uniref:Importin subunit alpha n=1 Tax=Arabis nemorensis TaxID=586526 RepID=A0A565BJ73_9BRAS|nr:unnamed protein product [Arabis nemorensis]
MEGVWRRQGKVDEEILIYTIVPEERAPYISKLLGFYCLLQSHLIVLMESLTVLVVEIWSEDIFAPHYAAVIQFGVLPRVVTFLSRDDFPELQFMAAWVLTNIASGTSEETKAIVKSGVVPIFIKLLSSASEDVRQVATWALGNVAGDSPKYRMIPLRSQYNEHTKLLVLRHTQKPQLSFEQAKAALPILECLVQSTDEEILERLVQSTDEEVLTYACSALSYLTFNSNNKIQAVIDAGVIPHLIKLLSHSSPSVLTFTLRTIGNIVTGGSRPSSASSSLEPYNKQLREKNQEGSLLDYLKHHSWEFKLDTMIEADIIQSLVWVLQTLEFEEVKKEAAWGISNAICGGTYDQIRFMVSQGCIKPICYLLACPDPIIITACLETLENILVVGEGEKNLGHTGDGNLYASMIDEAEGLEKIVNLQSHDNNEIYQKAAKIHETFWTEE